MDLTKEIEDDCDYLVGREVAKAMRKSFLRTGDGCNGGINPTTGSGPEKNQDALQELNSLIGLESQT